MKTGAYTDFVHTGPGTLAGRLMRRFWHPVYRSDNLGPGRAAAIKIMGEDLTLYRGESGTPHLVAFRCPHRGTQLSVGWVEKDAIRCFYHGWKFESSGQCIEQPVEPEPFCEKVKIKSYSTEEYLGLIWAYFGEGATPALPRYPEFEEAGVLWVRTTIWPCNYVQGLENNVDQSHIVFVHRDSSFSSSGLVAVPEMSAEESEYGITMCGKRPGGALRTTHWYMPNVNQVTIPPVVPDGSWVDLLVTIVPVDDEHCARFAVGLIRDSEDAATEFLDRELSLVPAATLGAAVLAGEHRIEDINVSTNMINVQDYVAQVGQGSIVDREHERLGPSDAGVILLRKIWSRELRALAESKPLKQWSRPERLVSTVGLS